MSKETANFPLLPRRSLDQPLSAGDDSCPLSNRSLKSSCSSRKLHQQSSQSDIPLQLQKILAYLIDNSPPGHAVKVSEACKKVSYMSLHATSDVESSLRGNLDVVDRFCESRVEKHYEKENCFLPWSNMLASSALKLRSPSSGLVWYISGDGQSKGLMDYHRHAVVENGKRLTDEECLLFGINNPFRTELYKRLVDKYAPLHFDLKQTIIGVTCKPVKLNEQSEDVTHQLKAIIAVENKNDKSFWSGSWKSVWVINLSGQASTLKGHIKVKVHYSEDGSIFQRCVRAVESEVKISSDPVIFARSVVAIISSTERQLQRGFGKYFTSLAQNMRQVRRPINFGGIEFSWS